MKKIAGWGIVILLMTCTVSEPQMQDSSSKTGISAPDNLKLRAVAGGLELTWEPAAEQSGAGINHEIYRAVQFPGGPYDRIAVVSGGMHSYIDTKSPTEAILYYRVRAVVSGRHSPYSNTVAGERPA